MRIFNTIHILFFSVLLFSSISIFATPLEDAAIQQDIASRTAENPVISGLDIKVEVHDGVVFLIGEAPTDKEAAEIVQVASSTPTVKEVDTSRLKTTKSEHPIEDTLITARVKGAFVKNKLFGDSEVPITRIGVETKNHVVLLTGTTETKQQADRAIHLARSVKGVKKVVSKVTVDARG